MILILFYVGAAVLFFVGLRLIKKATPHTRTGGDAYVQRKNRKTLGAVLIVGATLLLILALWTEFGSPNASVAGSGPAGNGDEQADNSEPDNTVTAASLLTSPDVSTNIVSNDQSAPSKPLPTILTSSDLSTPLSNSSQSNSSSPSSGPPVTLPSSLPSPGEPNAAQELNAELVQTNAYIQANPQTWTGYAMRATIYSTKKMWSEAEKDYEMALRLNGDAVAIKFDMAEMKFQQKNYDGARSGFFALEKDPNLGDLALYKVFLCDLFAGHKEVAAQELDALNQVGSNASYYFANIAWSLYHKNLDDARSWLTSASRIYPAQKFRLYITSLVELGYFPIPGPTNQ